MFWAVARDLYYFTDSLWKWLGNGWCYWNHLRVLEMKKDLMANLYSVPSSSHRRGTWASLRCECGQWEGFVTVRDSFYIFHVTDFAHHWNISQERQYSRGHQTHNHGIRIQVLSSRAHTSVHISRLKPLHLLSRMPGQCLYIVVWYLTICSKVTLEARNSSNKLTVIEYLHCACPFYPIEISCLTLLNILSHFMFRRLRWGRLGNLLQILVSNVTSKNHLIMFDLISNHDLLHWVNATSLHASGLLHCNWPDFLFLNIFII